MARDDSKISCYVCRPTIEKTSADRTRAQEIDNLITDTFDNSFPIPECSAIPDLSDAEPAKKECRFKEAVCVKEGNVSVHDGNLSLKDFAIAKKYFHEMHMNIILLDRFGNFFSAGSLMAVKLGPRSDWTARYCQENFKDDDDDCNTNNGLTKCVCDGDYCNPASLSRISPFLLPFASLSWMVIRFLDV
ncbi:unnamed protein product [Darwinula stevensoni]|uniref:Uncharacterized protein n=1 Tax=Darwinula stevensoni TaxID=69355 RepID=A0A7R9AFE6_9CRUS|nr:unnamed protein product [Darwinula stevensoni]CAG0902906.1 unnamed protein product [Darwinula stevensoni]